jgi:hypothetical protein
MHHVALIHEADRDRVAQLRDDWRGCGEAATVDREPAQRVVADPDDVLAYAVLALVAIGGIAGLDYERSQ